MQQQEAAPGEGSAIWRKRRRREKKPIKECGRKVTKGCNPTVRNKKTMRRVWLVSASCRDLSLRHHLLAFSCKKSKRWGWHFHLVKDSFGGGYLLIRLKMKVKFVFQQGFPQLSNYCSYDKTRNQEKLDFSREKNEGRGKILYFFPGKFCQDSHFSVH